ncbi:MAG: TonB-dependent receptor [Bacteroidetes bacterium]|nr:TonB-dependent receptor [Bacteroidota bacterium]
MLKRIVFFFAMTLMVSPLLFAQITTSSLNGSVTGGVNGTEPLVGATIVATHVPTGTKYSTTSKNGGSFSIQNMRPGGPYTIEITYVDHKPVTYNDIYLQLAESFILNSVMENKDQLAGVTVSAAGRRTNVLNPNRTGNVTNINSRQIGLSPSINRSINDLTKITPQSNGSSIGGGNYRQNNFTIDGADFNNSFGIGTNLPANGAPISIDAIDEISVSINPYDIRQSGFIGSAINAVTKSGTNTFSGSVYKYFRNERLRGRRVDKTYFTRNPEDFKQYGVRFGGPLIKDKLFFFVNYESETQPKTINSNFAATAGAPYGSANNIARPTADSLNYISNYLLNNYGYVTGPFDGYTPNITRKKVMARLDWNISRNHKFNIRYSQVEGGEPNPVSTSVGGAGTVSGSTATRQAITALWFKNSNYFQGANFYSFAGELNSNFRGLSNTLRATYTYQNDSRSTESQIFPLVDIMSNGGGSSTQAITGIGSVYTTFGYEPFSFGNLRKVKMYSIVDNITFKVNKHHWTMGGQVDFNQTINGFQRFATSYYRFASWADFASALDPNPALRKLPTDFAITYSLSKNFAPAFSRFDFRQYSAYFQDEIYMTKNFRLTLGARFDLPTYPGVPQILTHPLVLAQNFAQGEKVNTGVLPKSVVMISPRLGFNWDLYGDRSLQIRGGTGIFTGKIPFVWIVSQSGDNGMIQITQAFNMYNTNGTSTGVLTPGPFNPDPAAYRPSTVPAAGTIVPSSVTAMSPTFKNPQTWKSSIAIDAKMPWGVIGTFEANFNKDLNTAFFRSPNYIAPQNMNITGYPDNRPIYGATNQTRFINTLNAGGQFVAGGSSAFTPVIIDNGKRGYSMYLTAKFEKPFTKGFMASVAYTKAMAANLFDGGGDQALGAYQGTQQVMGLNTPNLAATNYIMPDRVVATVSYRKEYLKHLATTIALVYQGSADGRFSYVYNGDYNRDGVSGNDLLYIPTKTEVQQMLFANQTVNGVVFDQTAQRNLFESYIMQDKYMRTHRGQYAERNGGLFPWRNQVDAKFIQDIFAKTGKNKNTLQFTIDVFNLGNLLNPAWGKVKTINASNILVPQNMSSVVPGGSVVPQFRLATANGQIVTRTFRDVISTASTYSVQFGIRYLFN